MAGLDGMTDLVFEVWISLGAALDAMMDLEDSDDPSRDVLICNLKDAIDSCGDLIGKIDDLP